MSAQLRLYGVGARSGGPGAVRDVSLEGRRGEVVARIGSNGAGKTTTLRAITGLLPVRRGRVEFEGERLGGLGPAPGGARGAAPVPRGRQRAPPRGRRAGGGGGGPPPSAARRARARGWPRHGSR